MNVHAFLHHLKIGWQGCFCTFDIWLHLDDYYYCDTDLFWYHLNGYGVDDFHVWVDV